MKNNRTSTKTLILTGMMTAVIAALSQIQFPLPSGIPVTMQTFAVTLAACVLGWKMGTVSVAAYILLGIIGVPVFTGFNSGVSAVAGMTGGYIWGFLIMGLLCGLACSQKNIALTALFSLLGLAGCHIPGMIQFAFLTGRSIAETFLLASAPYLAKDIASIIAAYAAAKAIRAGLNASGFAVSRSNA